MLGQDVNWEVNGNITYQVKRPPCMNLELVRSVVASTPN